MRQEDLFFSQLTVRETLSLAAELQLSNKIDRGKYVNDLLNRLGLVRWQREHQEVYGFRVCCFARAVQMYHFGSSLMWCLGGY